MRPDILVTDTGTVIRFLPCSIKGIEWFDANVTEDPRQWDGASLIANSNYAGTLIEALGDAGLVVEVRG